MNYQLDTAQLPSSQGEGEIPELAHQVCDLWTELIHCISLALNMNDLCVRGVGVIQKCFLPPILVVEGR